MRRLGLISVLCAAMLLGAAGARAEIFANDGLFVVFGGGFTPHSLPRDRDAPITVNLKGSLRTSDGSRPPQLRRMSIAVNRYGRFETRGLPLCRAGLLESTDSRLALERCRSALVGRGQFGANLDFPGQPAFPVRGRMLAFNGRTHGRPVIFLHVHASNPVEATVVLTFRITHPRRGKYGTVLATRIPRIASDLGYVTDISMTVGRRYRVRGERRSFVSARCAAPVGFPGVPFTFARGVFAFADGKRVTTTLARDCVVR